MNQYFDLGGLQFVWDEVKNSSNLWKHGVKFEEAAEVFFDENYLSGDASVDEEVREFIIGFTFHLKLLFTVFVERGQRIRIISARRATADEEKYYVQRK